MVKIAVEMATSEYRAFLKTKQKVLNILGLQTPAARLFVILGASSVIYLIGYQSLISTPTLSVYSRLGIPSPSIGLTRAYWLLIHGDFAGAWQMNKLIIVVAPVVLGLVLFDLYKSFSVFRAGGLK